MPESIMISIAAAVACKGATSLYELVKSKLAGHRAAAAALEAAQGQEPGSPEVRALAEHLDTAAGEDPRFRERLTAGFTAEQSAATGGVNNQNSGQVTNLVQTRDITGNISFGS